MFNCFFYFESSIHKKYKYALENGKKVNDFIFLFKKDLPRCVYTALVTIIFKMIIIKLVLYKLFKISSRVKELMSSSTEIGLKTDELELLKEKRHKYLKKYGIQIILYSILLFIISIGIAFICICYGGIFPNSVSGLILGFIVTFIFSLIFCAFICFFIVSVYRIGKRLNNKCLLSFHYVLTTIY